MSNKLLAERSSSMGALESSSPHAPQASMTRKLTVVLQRRAPAKFPLLLTAISHQLPVMMKPAATHSTAPLRPLAFRTTAPPSEATHPLRVSQQCRRREATLQGESLPVPTRWATLPALHATFLTCRRGGTMSLLGPGARHHQRSTDGCLC